MSVETLDDLRAALSSVDVNLPFPPTSMRVPRGKSAGTQKVSLPEGYREQLDDDTPPSAAAEDDTGGG